MSLNPILQQGVFEIRLKFGLYFVLVATPAFALVIALIWLWKKGLYQPILYSILSAGATGILYALDLYQPLIDFLTDQLGFSWSYQLLFWVAILLGILPPLISIPFIQPASPTI